MLFDMIDVVKIASYISERYLREFGERIDEMKLHKLLYLTQRETIIRTGEPLFDATFHAWRYGPVIPEIRYLYKKGQLSQMPSAEEISDFLPVIDYVFHEYAPKRSFVLSNITHGEYSWQHAREGYSKYEDSDVEMSLDDIRRDAQYVKERRVLLGLLRKSRRAAKEELAIA